MITALVIVVVSPDDLQYALDRKVRDYLAAGARLVWELHPVGRCVHVRRIDRSGVILDEQDYLDGENILPGFRCRVGDLFQLPPDVLPGP